MNCWCRKVKHENVLNWWRKANAIEVADNSSSSIATDSTLPPNITGSAEHANEMRGRRMSYTSAGIAMGAFPTKSKACDPIIHILMYFESTESLPSVDDLVPLVRKAFEYERLAGTPTGTLGKNNWRFQKSDNPVHPQSMIRSINMSCKTSDEVINIVEDGMDLSLRGRKQNIDDDECLPWWEFFRIVNTGVGNSLLCFRVDHTLADGVSLAKFFSSLITNMDGSPMIDFIPSSLASRFKGTLYNRGLMALKLIPSFFRVLTQSSARFDDEISFGHLKKNEYQVYSGIRKCVMFDPIPLDFVKSLKNELGVSLNDIMITAISRAIRDYCLHRRCTVLQEKGAKVRCRTIINIAAPDESNDDKSCILRNRWAAASIDLALGQEDILTQLKNINTETMRVKRSPIALCQIAVQNALAPLLPIDFVRQQAYAGFVQHTLNCTNMFGPQEQVMIAGKPIKEIRFVINNLIPVATIVSYNHEILTSLTVDNKDNPDVHLLPQLYCNALVSMAKKTSIEIPKSLLTSSEGEDQVH